MVHRIIGLNPDALLVRDGKGRLPLSRAVNNEVARASWAKEGPMTGDKTSLTHPAQVLGIGKVVLRAQPMIHGLGPQVRSRLYLRGGS